jgi:hypothetical protein
MQVDGNMKRHWQHVQCAPQLLIAEVWVAAKQM